MELLFSAYPQAGIPMCNYLEIFRDLGPTIGSYTWMFYSSIFTTFIMSCVVVFMKKLNDKGLI
jgi:hypothetical protein